MNSHNALLVEQRAGFESAKKSDDPVQLGVVVDGGLAGLTHAVLHGPRAGEEVLDVEGRDAQGHDGHSYFSNPAQVSEVLLVAETAHLFITHAVASRSFSSIRLLS